MTYVLPASKEFVITGGSEKYGRGVGPIGGTGDPSVRSRLVFAVVGDRRLGTPLDSLFVFAVGTDPVDLVTDSELPVYPSPAKNTVTVEIGRIESVDEGRLSVYDTLGRRVHSIHLGPGILGRLELDVERLPTGMYLAVVTSGSKRRLATFIVAR